MQAAQRTRSSLQNPQNPISWQTSKPCNSFSLLLFYFLLGHNYW